MNRDGQFKMRKEYIRDKRSPKPLNENISRVMSSNKAKNTKPELKLRKALFANGIRGYRLNWKNAPGKPDIAFPGRKIAIFVNGCYWHRCPFCNLPLPKTNTKFWKIKFQNNIVRDKRNRSELRVMEWQVITIWECEIEDDAMDKIITIKKILNNE